MELKILIKNTSYLAGTRGIQFLAGIFRTKINAVILGTTGIGIVNQLTFLTDKMSQFTMLNMSEGVVKQIAESKDDEKVKELVSASLKAYIVLVLLFMILSTILFIYFSKELTTYVLGNDKYLPYFYIGLFSFPILILNSIPFSILKGFKDVKSISIARIGIIISNLIVFIPLVLMYKLNGAIIFIPLSYIITLLFNYFIVRKHHLRRLNIGFRTVINTEVNIYFLKELLLFSGVGLFVGSYMIISEFICRSIVIYQLGIESIGLYSPIITWAGLFTGIIIPAFSTYLYPRFAETKSNKEIAGIINDAIRLSTFALIPLLFIGISYRYFFIGLFYSEEFLGAAKYLPYHFIGVIFYVWLYIFSQSMSPTGRIKQNAFFYTIFVTLDIGVTYLTVPVWGLYGWMLKHMISPILFFIVFSLYANKSFKFNFSKSNIILMLYLIIGSLLLVLLISQPYFNIIRHYLIPFLILITWFLFNENEKSFLISKLRFYK